MTSPHVSRENEVEGSVGVSTTTERMRFPALWMSESRTDMSGRVGRREVLARPLGGVGDRFESLNSAADWRHRSIPYALAPKRGSFPDASEG